MPSGFALGMVSPLTELVPLAFPELQDYHIFDYILNSVLAGTFHGDVVRVFYRTPAFLWGIAPLLLLWVSRMWLAAQPGRMDADPVLFALKDPAGHAIAACGIVFFAMASAL